MIWHPEAHAAIRHLRGLSLAEEARTAAASPSYLSRLEHEGTRSPSFQVLSALARTLDVPVSALYIDPPVDQLMAELVAKIDGTRDRLDVAIDILQRLRKAS